MKHSLSALSIFLVLAGAASADPGSTVLFSDTFEAAAIAPDWTVKEGQWSITDGALTNTGGGLIVLSQMPGSRFELEAKINFPANWVSLILFYETPGDYGTLYFGGGYWESFEIDGGVIADYIQRRDPAVMPGVDRQVRVVVDYGRITLFYDGELKGEADLRPRPGARLAFRNLDNGGLLRVKTVRVTRLGSADLQMVRSLQPDDLAHGAVYREAGLEGTLGKTERLRGDMSGGLELPYRFTRDNTFESRFARLPLEAAKCRYVLLDVEGDGSGNKLFIIVHDGSGEQHLVGEFTLSWKGWQECVGNLTAFLGSPPGKQRFHTRWGGDENQRLDFPIKRVDIGVAKRGARTQDKGQVRFRNLRFVDRTD